MAKLYNRAKVGTATVGTGTMTLGAATSNAYCTFAEAGVSNGDTVSYVIEDGTDFEVGTGVYTTSGTTLTRASVTLSKIGGTSGTTKLNLSGSATVFISARKEDLLSVSDTQTANKLFAGPSSGGAAAPAFRSMVSADIPSRGIFYVDLNGSNQTGATAGANNKINFSHELVDANNWFDSSTNFRYTPLESGWYFIFLSARATSNLESAEPNIYKNGAAAIQGPYFSAGMGSTSPTLQCATIVSMNGSTDYIEAFEYLPATITVINGGVLNTFMFGYKVSDL